MKKVTYQPVAVKSVENSLQMDIPDLTDEDKDNLPTVSVVTVVNDRKFIGSLLFIWIKFIYPPKKLEWVVVEGDEDLEHYFPQNDDRIFYHRVSEGNKLDYAVSQCKNDYVLHMTEDSYHFPDSIIAKISALMHYKRAGLLCWNQVNYNIKNEEAVITIKPQSTDVNISGLIYSRKYWDGDNRSFKDIQRFVGKKYYDWMDLHFAFSHINLVENFDRFNKKDIKHMGGIKSLLPEKYLPILENIINL